MKKNLIRIATRKSPLAFWQAEYVEQALLSIYPDLHIELIGIQTTADKFIDTPLAKIGGKGLFVKELEAALLENNADIAVHSIKDLPAELPQGLMLATICEREDPRDVFIANRFENFEFLPEGACIGTSSLRRQSQIAHLRPDLTFKNLRGNVGTRLQKLEQNEFDAIILAAAGIKRLQQEKKIRQYFAADKIIPAIGQGAIGIECRENDMTTRKLIAVLDDLLTRYCITAERAMNAQFGGNCQIPIAAHAIISNQELHIYGMVGKIDGSEIIRSHKKGKITDAEQLGIALAQDLFAQGAKEILENL